MSSARHPESPSARRTYLDNLKVLLISLLVIQHAAHPYSPNGMIWPIPNVAKSPLLEPYVATSAALFLGLFFAIAGYFMVGSCARKGPGRFVRDRLVRLGAPLSLFAIIVYGGVMFLWRGGNRSLLDYYFNTYLLEHRLEYGHMWFIFHLLIYGALFALWCRLRPRADGGAPAERSLPGHASIALFIVAIAVVTWLVRAEFSVREWVRVLWVIPVEPAHMPLYLAMLCAGIAAARWGWLERWPASVGTTWLIIGGCAMALRFGLGWWGHDLLDKLVANGGLHSRSLVWSLWETLIAVGGGLGLLLLFRDRASRAGRLLYALGRSTYAVYLTHFAVIGALQLVLTQVRLAPSLKFAVVVAVGLPSSFALGHAVRQVPLVRRFV